MSNTNSPAINKQGKINTTLKISDIEDGVAEEFKQQHTAKTKETFGIFKIKSGNAWIEESKNRPVPKELWAHKLWFEFETCILFVRHGSIECSNNGLSTYEHDEHTNK